jgi:hypothetical protein
MSLRITLLLGGGRRTGEAYICLHIKNYHVAGISRSFFYLSTETISRPTGTQSRETIPLRSTDSRKICYSSSTGTLQSVVVNFQTGLFFVEQLQKSTVIHVVMSVMFFNPIFTHGIGFTAIPVIYAR